MPSPRQIFGANLSVLRTVAFVLSGRRTLSEHLPAEVVNLNVSLAKRSQYLRKALVLQGLNRSNAQHIHLPGVDSVGFKFYVEWLSTGRINFQATAASTSGGGLLLRDCFDLMFTHIVGSLFEEPDFQDYIIDTTEWHLDVSQTPDLKVLEEVFLENAISNVLRQFVIDRMFALERKMLGMIRCSAGESNGGKDGEASCKYHVHGKGRCYKTNIKYRNANGALVATNFDADKVNTLHLDKSATRFALSNATNNYCFNKNIPHSMTNPVGTPEWTFDHGYVRSINPPELTRFEKPLPALPNSRPESSPTPSSHPSLQILSVEHSGLSSCVQVEPDNAKELPKTQQLIQECLSRLDPTLVVQAQSYEQRKGLVNAPILELIFECIERFNQLAVNDISAHSTGTLENVSTDKAASEDTSFESDSLGRSSMKQESPCLSPIPDSFNTHPGRNFGELQSAYLPRGKGPHELSKTRDHASSNPHFTMKSYQQVQLSKFDSPSVSHNLYSRPKSLLLQSHLIKQDHSVNQEQPTQRDTHDLETSNCLDAQLSSSILPSRQVNAPGVQIILEQQIRSSSCRAKTPGQSNSHLGSSTPRLHHFDAQTSQKLPEQPFQRQSYAAETSNHPYAHLGFSTPRPRHVDAYQSQGLIGPSQQHEDGMPRAQHRRVAQGASFHLGPSADDLHQWQRHQLSNALAPVPASSPAFHEDTTVQLVQREQDPKKTNRPSSSAFGISSPNRMDQHQRQQYFSKSLPFVSSTSFSIKRKPTPSSSKALSIPVSNSTSNPSSNNAAAVLTNTSDSAFSARAPAPALALALTSSVPNVLRKPAPHRGMDWFDQQARNPWVDGGSDVPFRKSKKSRVKELLRSGSVLSLRGKE